MKTKFSELCPGDRFMRNGKLWTKVGFSTARYHGGKEHGRTKDEVCMFGQVEEVEYLEPQKRNAD